MTLKPNGSRTGTVTPLIESSDAIINQATVDRTNSPDDIRNKVTLIAVRCFRECLNA